MSRLDKQSEPSFDADDSRFPSSHKDGAVNDDCTINVMLLPPTQATLEHFNWLQVPKDTTCTTVQANITSIATTTTASKHAQNTSDVDSDHHLVIDTGGSGHFTYPSNSQATSARSSAYLHKYPFKQSADHVGDQYSGTDSPSSSSHAAGLSVDSVATETDTDDAMSPSGSGSAPAVQVVHVLLQVLGQAGAVDDSADMAPVIKLWLIPSHASGLECDHPALSYVHKGSLQMDGGSRGQDQYKAAARRHSRHARQQQRGISDSAASWPGVNLNICGVSDLVFPMNSMLGAGAFGQVRSRMYVAMLLAYNAQPALPL